MKDMATTIMLHLERTRASEASIRSERMLRGLGSFIEGNYSAQDWSLELGLEKGAHGQTLQEVESWSEKQFASQARRLDVSASPRAAYVEPVHRDMLLLGGSDKGDEISRSMSEEASAPLSSVDAGTSRRTTNLQQEMLSSDIKTTFSRATNIIRDVTGTDEAIFFDASVGTFGGLVDSHLDGQANDHDTGGSDGTEDQSEHKESDLSNGSRKNADSHLDRQRRQQLEKPCEVLGFSAADRCSLDGHHPTDTAAVMTEGFLRALLNRYPKGTIFTFDEHTVSNAASSGQEHEQAITKGSSKHLRKHEAETLRKIFPSVRNLAIVPLFDSRTDRWFAGGIVWTANEKRVLASGLELQYLAAFGNSIMTEVHRVDAKKADSAKTKFISSVSHELRSPLHGILGSVECLQDTELDAFQENLTHTVETCGKTLLDTIEHLLSYAKVNNLYKSRDAAGQSAQRKSSGHHYESDNKEPPSALDVDVDLSVIAEEVVETVYAGHDFVGLGGGDQFQNKNTAASAAFAEHAQDILKGSGKGTGGKQRIRVILDIDKAAESHWIFRTQAGAWYVTRRELIG